VLQADDHERARDRSARIAPAHARAEHPGHPERHLAVQTEPRAVRRQQCLRSTEALLETRNATIDRARDRFLVTSFFKELDHFLLSNSIMN
jgi:hypothetical protein